HGRPGKIPARHAHRGCPRRDVNVLEVECGAGTEIRVEATDQLQHAPAKGHVGALHQARLHVGPGRYQPLVGVRTDGHGGISAVVQQDPAGTVAHARPPEHGQPGVYDVAGRVAVIIDEGDYGAA